MNRSGMRSSDRFPDPMLASEIFAPTAQNCRLSLATTPLRVGKAFVYGSGLEKEEYELVTRRIFENIRLATAQDQGAATQYLAEWLGSSTVTAGVTLKWSDPGIGKKATVPVRVYPFASHLNLLSKPNEGLFFDPDDFVDR